MAGGVSQSQIGVQKQFVDGNLVFQEVETQLIGRDVRSHSLQFLDSLAKLAARVLQSAASQMYLAKDSMQLRADPRRGRFFI